MSEFVFSRKWVAMSSLEKKKLNVASSLRVMRNLVCYIPRSPLVTISWRCLVYFIGSCEGPVFRNRSAFYIKMFPWSSEHPIFSEKSCWQNYQDTWFAQVMERWVFFFWDSFIFFNDSNTDRSLIVLTPCLLEVGVVSVCANHGLCLILLLSDILLSCQDKSDNRLEFDSVLSPVWNMLFGSVFCHGCCCVIWLVTCLNPL